jgi:hypothetical protein
MNAQTDACLEGAPDSTVTYGCTFGHFNQTEPWSDVRSLSWPDLAELLTRHELGAKEGSCIVPATFRGSRRHKNDAAQIDVAMLDSDAGATMNEITTAVAEHGWTAALTSTYSHLTARTTAKRGTWDRFRLAHPDAATAPAAFLEHRGMHPRIAAGSTVLEETAEHVLFQHQPCPKFRVALPLLRPWVAASYDSQREANATWKARVEALAAALRLEHDQSCTDTSRLFYLPRRAADAPPAEIAVLMGQPCDIFELPAAPGRQRRSGTERRSRRKNKGSSGLFGSDPVIAPFTDPDTGELLDLQAWARSTAGRFEIVRTLKARRPDAFVGKVTDGIKHHIRCVNEDQHTNAGADAATMVINASDSSSAGFVHHCRHAHCDGVDRLVFLRRMLEQKWLKVADLNDPKFLSGDAPVRPLIRFIAGELPEVLDQAEQALLQADLGLYQRGTLIVRPGQVLVTVSEQRVVSAQSILEVGDHAMVEMMTRAAAWERYDARSKEWVPIDAPMKVAATYGQRVGRWRLPVLAGLINAPTLRADGSVLAAPGYDRATGLLLDLGGASFAAVPDRPTQAAAAAALKILDDLVATFPFVDPASRSVVLAAFLTACIRRSLPTAPMHAFTAPTAGSGKSMLVDLISLISSGREAGVISPGKTEEELEKRLGALLLAGDQVIAIDNCEAPLGGEFLCAMLTQQVVRPRILGVSKAPELPSNAFVTATGNNLVLVGDMTRRGVMCQLDPQQERPELRLFASNPIQTVMANRGRYLIAALTVLRAYHVAGRPSQPNPLGSFEDWSGWVRAALLWLGQADPVMTMEEIRGADPKLDVLTAVMAQWQRVIGSVNVSARDVIEHATSQRAVGSSLSMYPKMEFAEPDFREALLSVAGEGGAINSKRLGKWLALQQGRFVQGSRFVRAGLSAGILRWRLETADRASAECPF